jgi:hypothetical protein
MVYLAIESRPIAFYLSLVPSNYLELLDLLKSLI